MKPLIPGEEEKRLGGWQIGEDLSDLWKMKTLCKVSKRIARQMCSHANDVYTRCVARSSASRPPSWGTLQAQKFGCCLRLCVEMSAKVSKDAMTLPSGLGLDGIMILPPLNGRLGMQYTEQTGAVGWDFGGEIGRHLACRSGQTGKKLPISLGGDNRTHSVRRKWALTDS